MGVSGTGKTTLGLAIAAQLGWPFVEADDFHPAENVDKMRRGEALNDADRAPWLAAVHARIQAIATTGDNAVLACSALKQSHRAVLSAGVPDLHFVYLHGDAAVIGARLRQRRAHFMPAQLLGSQLEALEPPEDAVKVAVDLPTTAQVDQVTAALGLAPP